MTHGMQPVPQHSCGSGLRGGWSGGELISAFYVTRLRVDVSQELWRQKETPQYAGFLFVATSYVGQVAAGYLTPHPGASGSLQQPDLQLVRLRRSIFDERLFALLADRR